MSGPVNLAHVHMNRARNLIALCVASAPQYDQPELRTALYKVNDSQLRAGGPALRLALAMWHAHYRYRFPHEESLVEAEKLAFDHLLAEHSSVPKSKRYRVWHAIEAYIPVRERHFGQGNIFSSPVPSLGNELEPLPAAFEAVQNHWRLTRKRYLATILQHLLREDPTKWQREILAIAQATALFEVWKAKSTLTNWDAFAALNNEAWRYFHTHPFLWEMELGKAFTLLRNQARSRSEAA